MPGDRGGIAVADLLLLTFREYAEFRRVGEIKAKVSETPEGGGRFHQELAKMHCFGALMNYFGALFEQFLCF
ncbi:hypothetical protein ECTPHS_09552 [Ectothiorhodospira sp. PHS-1]|nr:hypothetical protein ECTPHS_09552 [Ectothiorhodospira sp. PHS-1]